MKNLEALVTEYGLLNKSLKSLKKSVDDLNKEIKNEMVARQLDSFESTNWKISYQTRRSESLDEDKVIKILTNANLDTNIVKMKPYVDEDALESAIYNGNIPADVLKEISDCKIVKETFALVVKEKN